MDFELDAILDDICRNHEANSTPLPATPAVETMDAFTQTEIRKPPTRKRKKTKECKQNVYLQGLKLHL